MDDIWSHLDTRPVLVISHDPAVAARCQQVIDVRPLAL